MNVLVFLFLIHKSIVRKTWTFHSVFFHHYKNIISCSLHKQLLPDNVKTCPLWMNLESSEKIKVTTHKSLVVKPYIILDFHSEYYIPKTDILAFHLPHVYILGKIIVKVNDMTCLWDDTINLNANAHVIIQKYFRYLVNKFTQKLLWF